MDRALWILLHLRLKGWLRRLGRSLFTLKGMLVVLLCLVFAAPMLYSTVVITHRGTAEEAEASIRFAPLVLFLLCVLNVVTAAGEQAIAFSPAEVNLLFAGPFSRRQLLAYKLVFSFSIILASALVMGTLARSFAWRLGAAYLGLILAMLLLQLVTMIMSLVGSMIGVKAYNRRRRWALVFLAALGVLALLHVGSGLFELSPSELIDRVEESPALVVVLAPFRWCVNAFAAPQYWPDLAQWALLALAVDLVLLVVVFALDAQYLETAAHAGEKIYAQIQSVRSGGMAAAFQSQPGKARFRLPDLPWWGGVGPIAWRQLTAAPRSHGLMGYLLLLGVVLTIPILGARSAGVLQERVATFTIGFMACLSFLLTPMITFDFRGDLDRMDILKTLPLGASRIVLGQLLTPVLITTLVHWFLIVVLIFLGHPLNVLLGATAFALPLNLLLFSIDNLLFLWYPTPPVAGTAGDFQLMGRNMLLMLAKFLILAPIAGVTGLACAVVYLLTELVHGPSWLAGLTAAWLMLTGCGIGTLPFVAQAFRRFNVARDMPR